MALGLCWTRSTTRQHSDQAVEVFVMLSGFVIALMLSNEGEPYDRYIFRRFMRLYPLFLIALVYGMMTGHLYGSVFGSPLGFGTSEQVSKHARRT
ncbi:acyltransferase family protein [Rhizobium laguerreae]|uniref:acyltransferase family protein n=1 Tax=Rhizobium laguerreae TaxID=1076926 RepID=UPI0035E4339F